MFGDVNGDDGVVVRGRVGEFEEAGVAIVETEEKDRVFGTVSDDTDLVANEVKEALIRDEPEDLTDDFFLKKHILNLPKYWILIHFETASFTMDLEILTDVNFGNKDMESFETLDIDFDVQGEIVVSVNKFEGVYLDFVVAGIITGGTNGPEVDMVDADAGSVETKGKDICVIGTDVIEVGIVCDAVDNSEERTMESFDTVSDVAKNLRVVIKDGVEFVFEEVGVSVAVGGDSSKIGTAGVKPVDIFLSSLASI